MATTRFSLPVWASGSDPFLRTEMNTITETLGAASSGAAGFSQGAGTGSRPAAGAAYKGFFYYDTTGTVLYYCDGSSWIKIAGTGAVENDHLVSGINANKITAGTLDDDQGPVRQKTYWGLPDPVLSKIFVKTSAPDSGDGDEGDIWFEY